MKNYISKILIVLGTLTFSFIFVNFVSASVTVEDCMNPGWTTPVGCNNVLDSYYAGSYNQNGYDYSYTTDQYAYNNQNQNTNNQSGTPIINNYYQSSPTTNKTTTSSTVKSTTASSTTAKSNTSDTNKTNTSTDDTKNTSDVVSTDSNNNGLTALSLRGSGGFLPSSFWQWLIVIFLILFIVILARVISKSHRTESHTVPAH